MWRRSLIHLLLLTTCAMFAMPLLLMLSGSLKTQEELARNPFGLIPETWTFENYILVFSSMPLAAYLRNTVLLCIGCVAGSLLSCSLVAYAISRIGWRGSRFLFITVMVTLLLPWQITMIPRFVLLRERRWDRL